jgi:hypothetical protein
MTDRIGIGPRISEATGKWLEDNFSSRNAGAEVILDAFPTLCKRALLSALAKLTAGEKSLIIDLHNAYAITPQMLGQGVAHQVADGIDLDGMDKKWGVAKKTILAKLAALPPFDLACLEIWATAYWQADHHEKQDLAGYVACLPEPRRRQEGKS